MGNLFKTSNFRCNYFPKIHINIKNVLQNVSSNWGEYWCNITRKFCKLLLFTDKQYAAERCGIVLLDIHGASQTLLRDVWIIASENRATRLWMCGASRAFVWVCLRHRAIPHKTYLPVFIIPTFQFTQSKNINVFKIAMWLNVIKLTRTRVQTWRANSA